MSKLARSKHNKRQWELYQKRKKAKKAKLAKQAMETDVSGAAAVPTMQAGQ